LTAAQVRGGVGNVRRIKIMSARNCGRFAGLLAIGVLLALVARGSLRVVAHEADGKPARLQTGTCDNLGGVAFQLTGVGATAGLDDAEIPAPEIAGAPSAAAVTLSVTTVAAPLADVVAGGHAIVVYESDEAMDEIVACGDVGGPMLGESLVVGLREVAGSGHSGIATLVPGEGGTVVTIYLGEGLGGSGSVGDDHDDDGEAGDHVDATPQA
jgi:hypothetical protein